MDSICGPGLCQESRRVFFAGFKMSLRLGEPECLKPVLGQLQSLRHVPLKNDGKCEAGVALLLACLAHVEP